MATGVTSSTTSALRHLKSVAPQDGWAAETGAKGVRLLRRSVPVSSTWFEDLALSQQKCVVGILPGEGGYKRAQVLVEANGVPTRWPRQLMIQTTTTTTTTTASPLENNNDEDTQIVMYAAACVLLMASLPIFISASYVLSLVLFPVGYLYALQTCPPMYSFDAKQRLKRVMRGDELPEDHPNRPKGFIRGAVARAQANVTAELAMSTGYEVSMWNVIGACIIATVRVPSMESDCYWVGAFGKWQYLGRREIPRTKYE